MNAQILRNAVRSLVLLFGLLFTLISVRVAYPGWNNDVDDIALGNLTGDPKVGSDGYLYYFSSSSDGSPCIRRWPRVPGETEDEIIMNIGISGGGILAVHDGHLYASYLTWAGNDVSGIVNVHGIAKINLQTLVITDAVSVNPDPVPYAIAWDHNGTLYIAGDSWTGSGDHYETNLFKKWSGSAWVTVGGGLRVNTFGYSKALRLGTDGTNIYVGGAFLGAKNGSTVVNSTNIIRWNVDTGLWTAMAGYGPSEWPKGIAISGTNVLVAGPFSGGIARYSNINGSGLSIGTLNGGGTDVVTLNGEFYVSGHFTTANSGLLSVSGIAKWSNGTWSALGSGISGDEASGDDLAANGNSVFLTGNFTTAGGLSAPYGKARWQGSGSEDGLRFTSGSVSGTIVTLNLAGIPQLVCEVQRLDFPSDTWVSQGTLTLNSFGAGTYNSSVTNGLGYFRAKSAHNAAYRSANAFGSIVGSIPPGFWLVGNPFPSMCRVTFKTGILCANKTGLGQKTGTWSKTMGLVLESGACRR
jgi:hypothetical protein